jgi:hypothetical protein
MSDSAGPVYEVTQSVNPDVIEQFDAWLVAHIEEMLQLPGFISAKVYAEEDAEDGRFRRVTHYSLDSEADLEQYLTGPAAIMRQSAIDRFGDKVSANRRILHNTDIIDGGLKPLEPCLNCRTMLTGQYCGNCGQRARSRLISIWELVQDAFGDLLELDSRIWQTLIPLITRPGKLTRAYLEGRRVRFMPPFRTYLVLSIVFFLVAFFDPKEELGILFEPEPDVQSESVQSGEDSGQEEIQVGTVPGSDRETAAADAAVEEDTEGIRISFDDDEADTECDLGDIEASDFPEWLARRLTKDRLAAVCERVVADDGRAFFDKLLDNVPAALFILLPLMALVLKALYPLSKRYYVEHLLFVVHFHAFFFLIMTLQILFARLFGLLSLSENVASATTIAASLYIPVYLYKAMRRVYEQGHLITIPKYLVLMTAYFAGFSFIFVFAAVFAAFSI